MKKWPWKNILICVGWLLLVAGVTPGAYIVVRLGTSHHQKPLSVPVSLKQGVFTSPYFTANSSGNYQVELNWGDFPARQTDIELDWKIEADNGSVIQQGAYSGILRGSNTVTLGQFQPSSSQRQRIVLNVHQDVEGTSANTSLEVGQPDTTQSLSYAIPFAAWWAAFVAAPGAILLFVLLILGAVRRKKSVFAA